MNEPWQAIRARPSYVEAIFCRLKFNVAEIYWSRAEDKKLGSKFAIKRLKWPRFAISSLTLPACKCRRFTKNVYFYAQLYEYTVKYFEVGIISG